MGQAATCKANLLIFIMTVTIIIVFVRGWMRLYKKVRE